MTDKNDNKNASSSSNDISEVLRRLRESFDNDRNTQLDESNEKDEDIIATDDEIKASLERIFEEASLKSVENSDDEEDVVYDDEDAESSWFSLGDDEDEDDDPDDEYIEATESDDEEIEEESTEDDIPDEVSEEEADEEDPDSDDPWYSDDEKSEEEESTEDDLPDEVSEEEAEEELPVDESDENEALEDEEVSEIEEEIKENAFSVSDSEGWFVVTSSTEGNEDTEDETEDEVGVTDDESVWYNAEEIGEAEPSSEEEVYQDDDFEDDDDYDEDFDDEPSDDPIEKAPESDYSEEDIYIFDAEKTEEDEYLDDADNRDDESDEEEKVIDETDIGLLTDLGVTDEDDTATARDQNVPNDYAGDISYDYDGGEYVLENQRNEIMAGYKNEKRRTLSRLIVCGSFALILFIYEMLSAAGVGMPGMLNKIDYPLSHIMISLQLLMLCTLISAKQLYVGAVDLINRNATPYSVSAAIVIANTAYSIVISIALPDHFEIFNFIGAFSILMSIAYEYLLLISEEHAFSVFSTKKAQKYAFITDETSEATTDKDLSLCAYATDFNKNYFFRMRKRAEDYKYVTYVVLAALGLSTLVFIVSLICRAGLSLSLKNSVMTVNLALPIGIFGAFSYPPFRATVKALGNRGAMVGPSSVDEYSKTRFVTFGEEELFTSLKTTHLDLKPSGSGDVSDVLCMTSVLLSSVGGPLKQMVESMQGDFKGSAVDVDEIFDDGISARTNGVEMLAGSAQFLIRHGVKVDESTDFKDVDENNEVLYISIDGNLAARYYLKYKPDPEFIKLVNALGARGISVGIRTRNPAINSDIIARRCKGLKYKIYTIKAPARDEGERNLSRSTTDSGIVAAGKASSLAYPLLACCDLKKYYRFDMILRIASASIGAAMVIVNAIAAGSVGLTVLTATLFQLFWMIPSFLFGILHFKHRSKKKKFKIVYK